MRYEDLEQVVYGYLRKMDKLQAMTEVNKALPFLEGAGRLSALGLRVLVQFESGNTNLDRCAADLDYILEDPRLDLPGRFKAHFLASMVGRQLLDKERWQCHNAAVWGLIPQFTDFEGRAIYNEARGLELFDEPATALLRYKDALAWFDEHIGPHDQADDLCQIGAINADLCRMYIRVGLLPLALEAVTAAERILPAGSKYRIHVHLSRALYHLTTREAEHAARAIEAAKCLVAVYPNPAVQASLGELQTQWYILTGETDRAGAMAEQVMDQARALRNVALLSRMEDILISVA